MPKAAMPAPSVVTKDWVPPTAPEPKAKRLADMLGVLEDLVVAKSAVLRAIRTDRQDDHTRSMEAIRAAMKRLAEVHAVMLPIAEPEG